MEQIIALGGGEFSQEPDQLALDRYIVAQTGKRSPKVCFLGQASAESADYTLQFYRTYTQLGAKPSHFGFYEWPVRDPEPILMEQDVIFVGGGNTRNMLAIWQAWDVPRILRQALRQGAILAGVSAGANCWFEQGITDSISPQLGVMPCLGFLPGSFCPHYDGEAERRPTFHRLLAAGEVVPGYAADDGAAFHFVDGALRRVVTSRPAAQGFRLDRRDDQVTEQALPVHYLG